VLEGLRTAATWLASGLALNLIGANVRHFAAAKGFDNLLTRGWDWCAARMPLALSVAWREKWWFWLVLGASAGLAVALWLTPAPALVVGSSSSALPMVKSEVVRLLDELPTLRGFMDRSDPLNRKLAAFLDEQSHLITLTLSPPDAAAKADAIQQEFQTLRDEFYHFLGDHGFDHDELYKLIDWNEMNRRRGEELGVIVVDLGNYANRLRMHSADQTPGSILQDRNLWDLYAGLREDQMRFLHWMDDTKSRINQRRDQLQQALRTAQ
jgi:hypothetical protein